MMYLMTESDRVGNRPVWSEYMVSRTLYTFVYILRSFLPLNLVVLPTSNGVALGWVVLTFLRD